MAPQASQVLQHVIYTYEYIVRQFTLLSSSCRVPQTCVMGLQVSPVPLASLVPLVSRGQLASPVLPDSPEQQDSAALPVLLVQQDIPVSLVRHD